MHPSGQILPENTPVISVSDLNRTTRQLLEEAYGSIWIQGELSNVAKPRSGHIYFSLKDEFSQVRCAFFKNKLGLNFDPTDGLHVIAKATVSLYEPRGDYQLIISQLILAGEGALQQAFELLKKKLSQEGLFDTKHKKPLPKFPTKIGVVTSPTGAAIRDILTVLKRRYPIAEICVYPTLVQGAEAAKNIVQALTLANKHNYCEVIILARGGGSLEDLWPFNEEIVARAIFKSTIPIISGVGHEPDITIADFIADFRAATPSAAAEHAVPNLNDIQQKLSSTLKRLTYLALRFIRTNQQQVDLLSKRLQHPGQKIKAAQDRLQNLKKQLIHLMKNKLFILNNQLASTARMLHAVSPLNTLDRGYAIVKDSQSGDIITTTEQVQIGLELEVVLRHGHVVATVTKI
jgi:exodeoxyribonuclease VII large subunit